MPEVFVVPLPVGEAFQIDSCKVTFVDANHCPGAVQMLFQVPVQGGECLRYVHTGDMRYSTNMNTDTNLCQFIGADAVFLDTTYCNPKFVFPSQSESINYVCETIYNLKREAAQEGEGSAHNEDVPVLPDTVPDAEAMEMHRNAGTSDFEGTIGRAEKDLDGEHLCCESDLEQQGCISGSPDDMELTEVEEEYPVSVAENHKNRGSTLFLVSTYVIGKEKILLALAQRCSCLVFVDERKFAILKCLDLDNFDIFTTNPSATDVHVVSWNFLGETWPFFRPNFEKMEKVLKKTGYSRIVGFVPTGWTYEIKKKVFSVRRKGPLEIHLVSYSEHSNYDELRQYVAFLRPKEIIPTVGLEGGEIDGKAVASMRKHFRNLVDETARKRRFIKPFKRKSEDGVLCFEKSGPMDMAVSPQLGEIAVNREQYVVPQDHKDAVSTEGADIRQQSTQFTTKKLDTASSSPPKADPRLAAAFGKGAKKRHRQIHEMGASPSNELMEPGFHRDKHIKTTDTEMPRAEHSIALPILASVSSQNVNPENCIGETSNNEVPVYSKQVSAEQRHGSLGKANEDVDLVFEDNVHETGEQREEEPGNSQIDLPGHRDHEGSFLAENTCDEPAKVSFPDLLEEKLCLADQQAQSQCGIRESIDNTSSVDGGRRMRKLASRRGEQSSMLQFFKKTNANASRGGTAAQSSILQFFKKTNANASCASDFEEQAAAQCHGEEPKHTEKMVADNAVAVQNQKLRERLDQTLTILEGALPEEKVVALLEQAGGDVGAALDLYYKDSVSTKTNLHHVGAENSSLPRLIEGSALEVGNNDIQAFKNDFEKESSLTRSLEKQSCIAKEARLDVKACSVALPVLDYKPVEHACWSVHEPAPYLHLARAFDLIEQESGRLKTSDMLCNMFRSLVMLSPEAVLPTVYLVTNRIAPDYENMDLNIGGSMVSAAIVEATGTPRAKLREMYNNVGDLGDVAQACRQTQCLLIAPRALTIEQVYSTLLQISKETGSGSSARKKGLVLGLLRACREKEMKYIVRTLVQNMRIGAMIRSVLPALAQAIVLHHCSSNERNEQLKGELQSASAAIVEAYNFLPNLNMLVRALLRDGIKAVLNGVTISSGIPIKPMLAKIANGIPEVFKRFQGKSFTCEYKYDGQRAQIHFRKDGPIKIFSRNCEDTTLRFPDVIDIVRMAVKPNIHDLILDAEIVAVDRENGNKLMAFQHLSTRERGRSGSNVSVQNIKVDVCIFVFDLMYMNELPLVKMSFRERRKRMHECFVECHPGYFGFAKETTIEANESQVGFSDVSSKVDAFLEEAIGASCEGIMVKALDEDSTYAASKRSDSWLKVKRDYVEGLHDTLDLVPIGAWHGNGRKAGWYSPFLLACYDSDREEFQSVCRVMSGFTDVFYKEMKEFFSGERILNRKPTYYHTLEEPDIWFSAELVWEIRGADLTVSPVHQAAVGLVHPSRGISMRFPRFIQERTDKKPEDASSPSDIADLFQQQNRKLDIEAHNSVKEQDMDS